MTELRYSVKQVIIVRTDLRMSKGKLAVQVAHASVSAFYHTLHDESKYPIAVKWIEEGQPKIVVKVASETELLKRADEARDLKLIVSIVRDAGLTELEPGTITCVGIGPDYIDMIDKVTGDLPLL